MLDGKQITVAVTVGCREVVHTLAMTVIGVTVEAGTAYGCRAETAESGRGDGELTLEELLSCVEIVE